MKKVLKRGSIFVLIIAALMISLIACDKVGGADKLVATKECEDDSLGKYTEEVTATFENDKAVKIEVAMIFEKEETAEAMNSLYKLGMSMSEESEPEGMEVKQEGNKFIIIMDAKSYAEQEGVSDEDLSKESFRKAFEEDGYTVK